MTRPAGPGFGSTPSLNGNFPGRLQGGETYKGGKRRRPGPIPGRGACALYGWAGAYFAALDESTALERAMSQALVDAAISRAAPSMWAATSSAGIPL